MTFLLSLRLSLTLFWFPFHFLIQSKRFLESKLNQFILQQQSPQRVAAPNIAAPKAPLNIKSETNICHLSDKEDSMLNCSLGKEMIRMPQNSGLDFSINSTHKDRENRKSDLGNIENRKVLGQNVGLIFKLMIYNFSIIHNLSSCYVNTRLYLPFKNRNLVELEIIQNISIMYLL